MSTLFHCCVYIESPQLDCKCIKGRDYNELFPTFAANTHSYTLHVLINMSRICNPHTCNKHMCVHMHKCTQAPRYTAHAHTRPHACTHISTHAPVHRSTHSCTHVPTCTHPPSSIFSTGRCWASPQGLCDWRGREWSHCTHRRIFNICTNSFLRKKKIHTNQRC